MQRRPIKELEDQPSIHSSSPLRARPFILFLFYFSCSTLVAECKLAAAAAAAAAREAPAAHA